MEWHGCSLFSAAVPPNYIALVLAASWAEVTFRKVSRVPEKAEGLHEQKGLFLPGLGSEPTTPRQTVT
jgi:hypothetical protein